MRDCDYILDKNGNFLILHPGDELYANLVFVPDENGDRYNTITKKYYRKVVEKNQGLVVVDEEEIERVFRPDDFFATNYNSLPMPWKKIPDSLIMIGVDKKDIGIFGSFLIGFELKKDIDFLVYGIDNCRIVMDNIVKIREFTGATTISGKHIAYQIGKYTSFYSRENSFDKLLKNKWSSLQFGDVLSTIRFVHKEVGGFPCIGKTVENVISGEVIDAFETNFVPRIFSINLGDKIIKVMTYFWAYQSCVGNGQKVQIYGDLDEENNLLILRKPEHWIKIVQSS